MNEKIKKLYQAAVKLGDTPIRWPFALAAVVLEFILFWIIWIGRHG